MSDPYSTLGRERRPGLATDQADDLAVLALEA
jgi:hypothetical protein